MKGFKVFNQGLKITRPIAITVVKVQKQMIYSLLPAYFKYAWKLCFLVFVDLVF